MSWVLILSSNVTGRIPAVIGGYGSQAEAELAGNCATAFPAYDNNQPFGHQGDGPFYDRYVVIPGAAASGPAGTTHCRVYREYEDPETLHQIKRSVMRYPEKRPADDNPFGRAYRDMIEAGVLKP